MKPRGRTLNLRSTSFSLFRRGATVNQVAYQLGISAGQARQLKYAYLRDFFEVTDYYLKENERRRSELVEKFLAQFLQAVRRGFNGLDDPEIMRRVSFIYSVLGEDCEIVKILLFPSAGDGVAAWETFS
ncbi:MAG: hypothetical protein HYY86_03080 [Candidatus Harrisonbacteria bacterium]|nr:hypothetical protein [Candidatus Harrisonbacteria bacterium]